MTRHDSEQERRSSQVEREAEYGDNREGDKNKALALLRMSCKNDKHAREQDRSDTKFKGELEEVIVGMVGAYEIDVECRIRRKALPERANAMTEDGQAGHGVLPYVQPLEYPSGVLVGNRGGGKAKT